MPVYETARFGQSFRRFQKTTQMDHCLYGKGLLWPFCGKSELYTTFNNIAFSYFSKNKEVCYLKKKPQNCEKFLKLVKSNVY